MALASLEFATLACSLLLLASPLPGPWRRAAILLASAAFLWSWLDAPSAAALVGLLAWGYGAATLARRGVRHVVPVAVAVLVTAFLVLKRYEILSTVLPTRLLHHELVIVGLSYVLFRQIQVLVDASQGQVSELDPLSYATFLLAFWSLLAGPIQRYQDFLARWRALGSGEPTTLAQALEKLDRIATGYVKVVVLGEALLAIAGPKTPGSLGGELVALYAYPAYIYVNFSGYCDIVIGLAAALGFELPENFDAPYLSRNVLDFWNRWHITLSTWLKGYLFNPLVKLGLERAPRQKVTVAAAAYFVTFFIAGVWHGSTTNFAIFGAFHAVAAAATKLYDEALKSGLGREGYKQYHMRTGIRVVATFLTLNWTALSFVFFRRSLGELHDVWVALAGGRA
jgi:D-alanyl-lipoteichoic acid acyltransferase DltB (MBOAT superfamily)